MSEQCPRARLLDAVQIELEGQPAFFVRDPVGLSEAVVVPPALYFFLAHCDGTRTVGDIKLAFCQMFQVILTTEDVERILADLDRHYLLDTERFRNHRDQVVEAYRSESIRRASHAGEAYPDDPEALRAELDSYYVSPEGPGVTGAPGEAARRHLAALIAPHISVRLGGTCFAWAYECVRRSLPADTYVILGTGHADIAGGFAATRKTFETPLGMTEVDGEFLERLEGHFGGDLCGEEIHHRSEHVIEFQLIFLQHALAGRAARIVPILCCYGPEMLAGEASSDERAEIVGRFCDALRRTLAQTPGSVCVICSADLGHIGHRYGDRVRIGMIDRARLEREDREMLEIICSGDAEGLLENLVRDNNRRRVCGFPCIYAMLRALDLKDGEMLRYGQSAMDPQESTVSYASVAFYTGSPGGAGAPFAEEVGR